MQVERNSMRRRFGKTLPITIAMFTIMALVYSGSKPITSVAAQDAADAPQAPAAYRPLYDFTGDARTDFSNVVADAVGTPITWKVLRNPADPAPGAAFIRQFDWGLVGDSITPHNYAGDAKAEVAVWRTGNFYTAPFPEGTGGVGPLTVIPWGNPTGENLGRDGDYDGDGIDDPTTVRLSGGFLTWVYKGSTSGPRQIPFGQTVAGRSTLAFQGADFTGDGRDEFVLCTASTSGAGINTWWIGDSVTGAVVLVVNNWGSFVTDYFVNPDDYTGDGKADIVTFRAGGTGEYAAGWFIRDTATGSMVTPVIFGIADASFLDNDAPVRANFDGDLKADIAVWRPSTATYYWINSSNGSIGAQQWGDTALTADFTEFPIPTLFCF